jgi:hypothetical protein
MVVTKDYITDEECSALLESLDKVEDRHWNFVVSHNPDPSNAAVKVFAYRRYMGNILDRLGLKFTTAVEILKYPEGTHSPVHSDGHGAHFDGSLKYRDVTWSKTSIVLLNDNFEGGELIFPNLGLSFGKEYKNALIEFPAGLEGSKYDHGVTTVTAGTRYTLVFRD